jgi:hypothetical protein
MMVMLSTKSRQPTLITILDWVLKPLDVWPFPLPIYDTCDKFV